MNKFFVYGLTLVTLVSIPQAAFAGGAAARSQQQAVQQRQMQQRIIQQRAVQQAVQQRAIQQAVQQRAIQQNIQLQSGQQQQPTLNIPLNLQIQQEPARNVETLTDVVGALNQSGRNWLLIIDQQAKELIVAEYIKHFKDQGIIIRKNPSYYTMMIDGMSQGSPEMLNNPFPNVLQAVAIMEYDFDNGRNKDAMARQLLGEQAYKQNLERIRAQTTGQH